MQSITFDYSSELVKRVSRQFIIHRMKRQYILVGGVGLYGIITLLAGSRGLLQGASIMLFAIYFLLWFNYYRSAQKVAEEMTKLSVTVKFDNEEVTFQTEDHTSIIKWPRVKQILRLNEAWLFFIYSNDTYSMVPTSLMNEELKKFIEQKLIEHGGQII